MWSLSGYCNVTFARQAIDPFASPILVPFIHTIFTLLEAMLAFWCANSTLVDIMKQEQQINLVNVHSRDKGQHKMVSLLD